MGGKVDFAIIREAGRRELIKLLDSIPGQKALVWDHQLAGTFGLIGDFAFLREHEVTKMFYISSDKLPQNNVMNIIFLTRPFTSHMDLINKQIRMEGIESSNKKEYHIWFAPRITMLCEDRLQHHGIYGAFTNFKELPIHLFRLDNDLASMELSFCYRDLHVTQDPSCLFHIARALMGVQGIYGLIPNVFGKGAASKTVFDLMVRMRRELAGNEPQVPPQIDQLILIDRTVDLISPLATQLTYEGLIDQFFNISNCTVKLPLEKFSSSKMDSAPLASSSTTLDFAEVKNVNLTSSDNLYNDIRDLHFSAVGPRLSAEAKEVSSQFDKRRLANSVSEMKQFVQRLPQMQLAKESLATRMLIC